MKKIGILFIVLFFSVVFGQKNASKISVTFNKNIETYFLAEILSAEHRRINKDFELYKIKEASAYQPIVERALKKYGNLKNSNIARKTAEVNDILIEKYGLGDDMIMFPLLSHEEFPAKDWKNSYQFKNNTLSKEQNEEITILLKDYIMELQQFYIQERIDDFFAENENFYKGATMEFNQQIPPNFIAAMEQFYGEGFYEYIVLVSPMMMWPIEDNEGRGMGVAVKGKEGESIYEIASPFVKVEGLKGFGYGYEFQAQFLTVHEFGHSFVNKEVYKNNDQLKNFKRLFEQSHLREVMTKMSGYRDYQTCVTEHLVRLGEIQTAKIQNDFGRAKKLEDLHKKSNFIFLLQLEEKLKDYHANRTQYKTFGDFVPQLLQVFENSSVEFINNELEKNKL